ncbi:unnamed protein product, partial [marine sediment metagenome]
HLGCSAIQVLYVKYAASVPDDYLEAMLALPEDRFRFCGLQKIESGESIEGYFRLSRQYSSLDGLERLDEMLEQKRADFFQAMRFTAGHLFFREVLVSRQKGQPLLLIEDGGYLAPWLNRFCLEGKTLRETLQYFGLLARPSECDDRQASIEDSADIENLPDESELEQPLGQWLSQFFPGSIEHTRNGYDYLSDVVRDYGRLAFPACSIAVSQLKRGREAEEVATSILHAVESILHGQGRILSVRRALVLGS